MRLKKSLVYWIYCWLFWTWSFTNNYHRVKGLFRHLLLHFKSTHHFVPILTFSHRKFIIMAMQTKIYCCVVPKAYVYFNDEKIHQHQNKFIFWLNESWETNILEHNIFDKTEMTSFTKYFVISQCTFLLQCSQ